MIGVRLTFDPADMVRAALREDLGRTGDATTDAVLPDAVPGEGVVAARESLVLAGLPIAAEVFRQVDPDVTFEPLARDGQRLAPGDVAAKIRGSLGSILRGERVALNFMQHLSGVATQTARYAALIDGGVRLLDTRKTTPGLRAAEKYAVRAGGGHNHRFALYDGVLIKDNHIAACGSVTVAVERALAARHPLLKVEVEVESLEQALEAVAAGADGLLLDNQTPDQLRELVRAVRAKAPHVVLEASGGITETTLPAVAATGVDAVSCGALIHGARWVDLGLDL